MDFQYRSREFYKPYKMGKNIALLFAVLFLSSCSLTKIGKKSDSLEGQKWSYSNGNNVTSVSGFSITFLANNKFVGEDYYSGGAYWNRPMSGKYYYNDKEKTVFLKYDKNKAPIFKENLKQQLSLVTEGKETSLRITSGWQKLKEPTPNPVYRSIKFADKILEAPKFRIEYLIPTERK